MIFRTLLSAFFTALVVSWSMPVSADDHGLSPLQVEEIENIIEEYLVENPEVLIRAMDAFRAKQARGDTERTARTLAHFDKELRFNPASPATGNPKGDVTIVEFFDYRCPYCKQVLPMIKKLLETDKNVRYVFKEFPILGPDSVVASRAAIAVWKFAPEKYMALHTAMMGGRGKITAKKVFSLAEKIGLNPDTLRLWMKDAAIDREISLTARMAQELGITGTPAFIIGDQVIPGAIDEETLKMLVQETRAKK